MKPYWLLALGAAACSLASSLDDLRGGGDPDGGGGTGAKDGGAGTGGAGGADGGGSGGNGGSGGSGGIDGGAGGASGASGAGGTNPWPDAADPCAGTVDCNGCCATSHAEGQQEFVATIKKCVCQDPSCSAPCSGFCSGGPISGECSSCVASQGVQTCIGQDCSSEACAGYTACVAGC